MPFFSDNFIIATKNPLETEILPQADDNIYISTLLPPAADAVVVVDYNYMRPGGVDTYFRPGGIDTYIRP